MSGPTALSTDAIDVHVRLLDEGVDVWRPVTAIPISEHVFRLVSDPIPDDEEWAFGPGEEVVAERRVSADGQEILIAVARASDLDQPSSLWLRKAS